jgi:hypothetical protein
MRTMPSCRGIRDAHGRLELCQNRVVRGWRDSVLVAFVGGFFSKPARRFQIAEGDGYEDKADGHLAYVGDAPGDVVWEAWKDVPWPVQKPMSAEPVAELGDVQTRQRSL